MAPITKRRKPNPTPVSVIEPTDGSATGFTAEAHSRALELIQACLDGEVERAKELVAQGADAWVQDAQGWSALHAAASIGDASLVQHLLRKGNAVWNLTDCLGLTAGDIAWSLNEGKVYELLLGEGIRAELLKAVMKVMESDEEDEDDQDMESTDLTKKSTASDNKTFLASKLTFKVDAEGQEAFVDEEGNGVMMGWEKEIMAKTSRLLCESRGGQEDGDDFNVINVGFGLGIIDMLFQDYEPTNHIIIEPHPDVLAHARSKGWFEKPGVRFYEGTWKSYVEDLETGTEEYIAFDAVYFDTYSEHYSDLHAFFDALPTLLRGPDSRFSFFHGLGATSRFFYDVYTTVSELHLRETGLSTDWDEVKVENYIGRWESVEQKYWGEVGPYRIPICRLQM